MQPPPTDCPIKFIDRFKADGVQKVIEAKSERLKVPLPELAPVIVIVSAVTSEGSGRDTLLPGKVVMAGNRDVFTVIDPVAVALLLNEAPLHAKSKVVKISAETGVDPHKPATNAARSQSDLIFISTLRQLDTQGCILHSL